MSGKFVGLTYTGDETDETVNGTAAPEQIFGISGSDTLRGGGGNDTIYTGRPFVIDATGVDKLYGDAGDDDLYATPFAAKNSLLDGGDGIDRVHIEMNYIQDVSEIAPITFALAKGSSFVSVGGKQTLLVKNAERLSFDGYGNRAVISGGDGFDSIAVNGSGAVLKGFGGDDSFRTNLASKAQALVDGGAGTADAVSLANVEGLTLVMSGDLATTATIKSGSSVVAILKGIEALRVSGGAGNDVLSGGSGNDGLQGGLGKNTLKGGLGDDAITVTLDDATDTAGGGDGSDTLTLFGGGSAKAISMSGSLDDLSVKLGAAESLAATRFEAVDVTTGSGSDKLLGGALADKFNMGSGADTVAAGAGDDAVMMTVDDKFDTVDGGGGVDKLTLTSPFFGTFDQTVTMTATSATGFDLLLGGKKVMHVTGMDQLDLGHGSAGADTLVALGGDSVLGGDKGNDKLTGQGGDDQLSGGEGDDTLFGGGGDDYLSAGGGKDILNGGGGSDTAALSGSGSSGVVVTLDKGRTVDAKAGGVTVATLTGIENLAGSTGADRLTGDKGDNVIGASDGSDVLDGGAGSDTVDYSRLFQVSGGFTVTLKGAQDTIVDRSSFFGSGQDTLRNFENVFGSNSGDTITGDRFDNEIRGGGGSDVLRGGAGNDTLDGGFAGRGFFGSDADTLDGGAGNDTFYVDNQSDTVAEAKGGGNDTVITGAVSFTLAKGQEIETLKAEAGIFGPNLAIGVTLAGNEFANRISGWIGGDTLTGNGGADRFVFDDKLGTTVDAITDFARKSDAIELDGGIFAVKADKQRHLLESAFKDLGVENAKLDGDDRVIYDRQTGNLSYDTDGSGKAAAVLFAHLDNRAALSAADFIVA